MTRHPFLPHETFEQMRERMVEETARFIEWGLAHPKLIPWIPVHVVERGGFSARVKAAFWDLVWTFRGLPN
jgi:hypothetical protein